MTQVTVAAARAHLLAVVAAHSPIHHVVADQGKKMLNEAMDQLQAAAVAEAHVTADAADIAAGSATPPAPVDHEDGEVSTPPVPEGATVSQDSVKPSPEQVAHHTISASNGNKGRGRKGTAQAVADGTSPTPSALTDSTPDTGAAAASPDAPQA